MVLLVVEMGQDYKTYTYNDKNEQYQVSVMHSIIIWNKTLTFVDPAHVPIPSISKGNVYV